MEQRTQEWLDARVGRLTASNFDQIMTPTGKPKTGKQIKEYAYTLLADYLRGYSDEITGYALEHGVMYEPEAKQLYQDKTFQVVGDAGFIQWGECELVGGSPDGLLPTSNGLIEIKCPFNPKNHILYMEEKKHLQDYNHQMQGYMMLTGAEYCDFVSYVPSFPDNIKMYIDKVERDEKYISNLQIAIYDFMTIYEPLRAKYS